MCVAAQRVRPHRADACGVSRRHKRAAGTGKKWGEFSNFYPAIIHLRGKEWPTTEHFFQAMKFEGTPHEDEIRAAPSAGESGAWSFARAAAEVAAVVGACAGARAWRGCQVWLLSHARVPYCTYPHMCSEPWRSQDGQAANATSAQGLGALHRCRQHAPRAPYARLRCCDSLVHGRCFGPQEEVKDDVMTEAVRAKFTTIPALKAKLLATGEAKLVEHTRNDRYWGALTAAQCLLPTRSAGGAGVNADASRSRCWRVTWRRCSGDGGDGSGKNMLGKILMKVRAELVAEAAEAGDAAASPVA